jgi:hypothetical protein
MKWYKHFNDVSFFTGPEIEAVEAGVDAMVVDFLIKTLSLD